MSTHELPPQDDARPLALFSVLWSAALLFQLVAVLWLPMNLRATPPTLIGIVELALMGATLVLLLKPGSVIPLLAAAALNLTDMALSLPHAPNHRLLSAFINLLLLGAAATSFVRLRRFDAREVFRLFAPAGRVATLIIYFFVTFHKVNSDFIDPEVSCTSLFYRHILATLPWLPSGTWVFAALPWATLLIEGALPLLFLYPRTRHFGVLLGVLFHSLLALDVEKHFFDFSSTMLALLCLFLDQRALECLSGWAVSRKELLNKLRTLFVFWYLAAFLAGLFYEHDTPYLFFFNGRQLLWWCYDATVIYFVFYAVTRNLAGSELRRPFAVCSPVLIVILALMLLNGIAPYLGLKTRSSFDMYANLRVVDGSSNHLLLTHTLDPLGYLHNPVQIRSSSDAGLMAEYGDGYLMPEFEFQSYLSTHPDISVEYIRNGASVSLARAGDAPEFRTPPSFLKRKLLWFRPIDSRPKNRCQW